MPINLETIQSVFDDDLTLMQWLKTVEDAVKNDTLEGVTIKKKPYHNEYAFDFLFKDGTHLETNYIAVGKGDKGDKGDTGAQGPQGPQGETGPQGLTPHIDNVSGNWFIGDVDTNVQARGPQGLQGPAGSTGAQGATGPKGDTGEQGVGINSIQITNGHLMITLTNSTTIDAGLVLNFPTTDIACNNLSASGLISGNEIIENMTGYSWTQGTPANVSLSKVYVGAVKNGNKLTLVVSYKLTPSVANPFVHLGSFIIPSNVGNKIFPVQVGSSLIVVSNKVTLTGNSYSDIIEELYFITHNSATSLEFYLSTPASLIVDKEYYVRIESTISLSESL